MASYLITGASRGIGLAMARTLASKPANEVSVIFAAARTQTDDLKRLVAQSSGRIHPVSMDVESKNSIQAAVATVEHALSGKGLDVLINNAGIMPSTRGGIENMDNLDTVTPQERKPEESDQHINNTWLDHDGTPIRTISSARFLAISPGWVKTDLGGDGADITAEQSVQGLLDIIVPATHADNGKFFNIRVPGWEKAEGLNQYDGAEVPW